jgi:hypothetical protein
MKELAKELGELENYGKFLHRISNKVYVAKTEDLIKLEFDNKKWLYELPKNTLVKCFEFSAKGISNKISEFELKDLQIITSISYGDLKEVFYIEQ